MKKMRKILVQNFSERKNLFNEKYFSSKFHPKICFSKELWQFFEQKKNFLKYDEEFFIKKLKNTKIDKNFSQKILKMSFGGKICI